MSERLFKLDDIATSIKSANAGASMITFDISFDDVSVFDSVVAGGSITTQSIADKYGLSPSVVKLYNYRPATTIKITIPRPSMNGGVEERDFDGVQQFAPLLDLQVRCV